MTSYDITTNKRGENITINLVFYLPNRQDVALESLFKIAMQVFRLSQSMQKHEPTCGKDSFPSVKNANSSAFGVDPLRVMLKVGGPHHGVGAWPYLATIRCGMSGLIWLIAM